MVVGRRDGPVLGLVGLAIVSVTSVVTSSAVNALDGSAPVQADWVSALSPTADPISGFSPPPSDVFEYGGVLFVADLDGVDRFDATTGAPLASFAAPAGVSIADIVIDTDGSIYATGTVDNAGDPDIWIGRYTPAGSLDWSDSFGHVLDESLGGVPVACR